MASRKPQRTEIKLPSDSVATVRKATARDMRLAEQANTTNAQRSLTELEGDQLAKLRQLRDPSDDNRKGVDELDPDRMMLERHDAETLVDACTVGVDFPEPIGDGDLVSASLGSDESWMDVLDADDHEALFEGIMWFSRMKPSLKKA